MGFGLFLVLAAGIAWFAFRPRSIGSKGKQSGSKGQFFGQVTETHGAAVAAVVVVIRKSKTFVLAVMCGAGLAAAMTTGQIGGATSGRDAYGCADGWDFWSAGLLLRIPGLDPEFVQGTAERAMDFSSPVNMLC
ncbi:MAG: hypothetical protein AAGA78_19690 [Pseudomonadota bacterium]